MTDLSEPLRAVETKYLIADGLMLRAENECISKNLVADINGDFDALMVQCISIDDDALLPGTAVKLVTVKSAKLEFDTRVNDWFDDIELTKAWCDIQPQPQSVLPKANLVFEDTRSTGSRRTGRSSGSSLAFKREEGLVKMKLARFAKEKEIEKLRMTDVVEKELREVDKRLRSVTRQAEAAKREAEERPNAAKREAEEKAKAVKREAEEKIETARREAARLQERASRQALLREKEWEVRLAEVEAEVWLEEGASKSDLGRLNNELERSFQPIHNFEQNKHLQSFSRMHPQPDVGTSSAGVQQLIPKIISTALDEPKTRSLLEVRPEANTQVGAAVPNGNQGSSNFCGYVNDASYPTDARSIPKSQPNFFPSHSPAAAGLSSGDRNLVVHPTSLQDYPPPRPVIQVFEGDPLTYWPFV